MCMYSFGLRLTSLGRKPAEMILQLIARHLSRIAKTAPKDYRSNKCFLTGILLNYMAMSAAAAAATADGQHLQ